MTRKTSTILAAVAVAIAVGATTANHLMKTQTQLPTFGTGYFQTSEATIEQGQKLQIRYCGEATTTGDWTLVQVTGINNSNILFNYLEPPNGTWAERTQDNIGTEAFQGSPFACPNNINNETGKPETTTGHYLIRSTVNNLDGFFEEINGSGPYLIIGMDGNGTVQTGLDSICEPVVTGSLTVTPAGWVPLDPAPRVSLTNVKQETLDPQSEEFCGDQDPRPNPLLGKEIYITNHDSNTGFDLTVTNDSDETITYTYRKS